MVRTAIAVSVAVAGALLSSPAAAQQVEPVTVSYRQALLENVLCGFSALTARIIVLREAVSDSVTIEIRHLPWDQALDSILAQHGLRAEEDSLGILRVVSRSSRERLPRSSEWSTNTSCAPTVLVGRRGMK